MYFFIIKINFLLNYLNVLFLDSPLKLCETKHYGRVYSFEKMKYVITTCFSLTKLL